MAGPASPQRSLSDTAFDIVAAVLLAVFVGILVLGYFVPTVPYASLATLPLLGSLATLFWANLRADRIARGLPTASPP